MNVVDVVDVLVVVGSTLFFASTRTIRVSMRRLSPDVSAAVLAVRHGVVSAGGLTRLSEPVGAGLIATLPLSEVAVTGVVITGLTRVPPDPLVVVPPVPGVLVTPPVTPAPPVVVATTPGVTTFDIVRSEIAVGAIVATEY
jgi:hypothetical protein